MTASTSNLLMPLRGDFLLLEAASGVVPKQQLDPETLGYSRLGSGHPNKRQTVYVRGLAHTDVSTHGARLVVVVGEAEDGNPSAKFLRALQSAAEEAPAVADVAKRMIGNWAAICITEWGAIAISDHMGSWPIYRGRSPDGARTVFGTALHDVARSCDRLALDPDSVEEFILAGSVTSPYTMLANVKRQWPGSVSLFRPNEENVEITYWRPQEEGAPNQVAEAAELAKKAMQRNLEWLQMRAPNSVLQYSGGEDSRVLAANWIAAAKTLDLPLQARGVVFLDRKNREWYLAAMSAKILGLPISLAQRRPDHYVYRVEEMTERIGLGYDLADAHSTGLLGEGGDQLHIDGWTSDSFLKAIWLSVEVAKGLRSPEGLSLVSAAHAEPLSHEPRAWHTRPFFVRRQRKVQLIAGFRNPAYAPDWAKNWPLSDHNDYGIFASNVALRRSVSPYSFANIIDAVRGIQESDKLNRKLFWSAFGRDLGLAGWVPRSGGEIPGLPWHVGRIPSNAVRFGFKNWDRARVKLSGELASGPWPSEQRLEREVEQSMMALTPTVRSLIGNSIPQLPAYSSMNRQERFRYMSISRILNLGEFHLPE